MAEEELKVEEEKEVSVGGEEELKVKEQKKKQEELLVKQKAAEQEENPEDEEKKEATLDNEPRETSGKKREHGKLPLVEDQDISMYLWKTLLKGINEFNQWAYDWIMSGVDSGLSKREIGPSKPEASKEEKVKHTCKRGKGLYEAGKAENEAFAKSISNMPSAISGNIKLESEKDSLKNVMLHARKIAHDAAVSEFLFEKMSKDKDFSIATTDKESLDKEIQDRVQEKHERLMSGVMATFYYSSNIEAQTPQETIKSCEEYLKIRETETNDIKNLVIKDLEAGNFVANDKKPSKDIGVKLNAYNQSFARELIILPSAVKESINLVESSALSDKEKIGLQQLAETEKNFRIFEETSVANLAVQRKAIDEAIKANRNNPARARIAAMKSALGKNPVSARMVQKYADNAILRAATRKDTSRK